MSYDYHAYDSRRKKSKMNFFPYFVTGLLFVILILIAQSGLSYYLRLQEANRDNGKISENYGSNELKSFGILDFYLLEIDERFLEGDTLRTGSGSAAKIDFNSGHEIYLAEDSELYFYKTLDEDSRHHLHFKLKYGELWVNKQSSGLTPPRFSFHGENMRVGSFISDFWFVNRDGREFAYASRGELDIEFLINDNQELVIEAFVLGEGMASELTPSSKLALENREDIELFSDFDFGVTKVSSFINWARGNTDRPYDYAEQAPL